MKCRHCNTPLDLLLVDLGSAPPSNAYLTKEHMTKQEVWLSLRVLVCEGCWLVQTDDYAGREMLFTEDYAYFSSFSVSWLAHASAYVNEVIERFDLGPQSCMVDIAANDGYLLQYAVARGIPCYGIEPTASTADAARAKKIEIVERFFGVELGKELAAAGRQADVVSANNVLAHVPDINDFVSGYTYLLKPEGVATFEFPHLMSMVANNQFDTVYHEHYSYLSLTAVHTIFAANGLVVFDVEEIGTHGGSLRVFAKRAGSTRPVSENVDRMIEAEATAGLKTRDYYAGFQLAAETVKFRLLEFLLQARRENRKVGAYGAAAKGNTLLNFSGVRHDLLPYVVDRNPAKQDKYMPGSRIPIVDEEALRQDRPDYVLILPWNLRTEVIQQLAYIGEWGGKFVVAVPELEVL